MTTKFKDFEEMMEELGGLEYDDLLADDDCEEINGYLAMHANSQTALKALVFAEKHKLQVITESIFDDYEDDNILWYTYCNGFSIVNRERYFFVKKQKDFICEEKVDFD
jgi:hypothetical protein